MLPYYASLAKIAYIVSAGGTDPHTVETVSSSAKGTASLTPGLEGIHTRETISSSPELTTPQSILGQLQAAIRALEPRLVTPSDPTLSYKDWFEIIGDANHAVLHPDSGPAETEIAVWFLEVPIQELEVGYWIVLTGSPGNLSERASGEHVRNRSGSGTNSIFHAFRAAATGQAVEDASDPQHFFTATSWMRGMARNRHTVRGMAEVSQIVTLAESGYTTNDSHQYPIVKVVVASPLFIERFRTPDLAATSNHELELRQSWWRRALAHIGIRTTSRRTDPPHERQENPRGAA